MVKIKIFNWTLNWISIKALPRHGKTRKPRQEDPFWLNLGSAICKKNICKEHKKICIVTSITVYFKTRLD